MEITEEDLFCIHTYRLKYEIDQYGIVMIKEPDFTAMIQKRPYYCDRGRFSFTIQSQNLSKVWIDEADAFPRYFFKLQNAFDELNEWIKFWRKNQNENKS
jgi:hypothetical protein